jgi:hypothetical protein
VHNFVSERSTKRRSSTLERFKLAFCRRQHFSHIGAKAILAFKLPQRSDDESKSLRCIVAQNR